MIDPSFETGQTYPPSVSDSPIAFMFTVFGLMLIVLFFSEWAWRLTWSFIENPAPKNNGITANRIVTLLLLSIGLIICIPTLFMMMKWPEASPQLRANLALARSLSFTLAGFVGVVAWIFAKRTQRMTDFELAYDRPIMFSQLRGRELTQTLLIVIGAFVISFATAYAPLVLHQHHSAAIGR